jgi:hypothetical protein
MGLISSAIRLPLTTYADEFHEQMKDAMKTAGITTGDQT